MSITSESYDRAVRAKEEGRYSEAVTELEALLVEDPTNPDAHWQMGLVLCFMGDFDGSLAELQKAVDLDSGHIRARNDLAMTHMMLGNYEEAKSIFLTVLADDPGNEVATRQLVYFT
ncbi:MAG: tetratricopeptide repeat protein [Fimbriimonadia bacterium]